MVANRGIDLYCSTGRVDPPTAKGMVGQHGPWASRLHSPFHHAALPKQLSLAPELFFTTGLILFARSKQTLVSSKVLGIAATVPTPPDARVAPWRQTLKVYLGAGSNVTITRALMTLKAMLVSRVLATATYSAWALCLAMSSTEIIAMQM